MRDGLAQGAVGACQEYNPQAHGEITAQMFWQARACEIRPFYSGLTFD
jgi:cysteine synthase